MSRAVQLVDRYGDELDYDFHARLGINLDELWFRTGAEPWEKLLSLAGQLPPDSRYMAALYDDDDMVAAYIAEHGHPEPSRTDLTLEGWTPERAQLVSLTEAVMGMHRTLIAIHSKTQPPEAPKLPRPRTAWDRFERRKNVHEARSLIERFAPQQEAG